MTCGGSTAVLARAFGVAENFKTQPTIESVRDLFSAAGDVAMVRVRHQWMQTPAGATKPSGLDLIATPSNAVHALIEFNTRDDAARAAETLNDDKDWRNGLRRLERGEVLLVDAAFLLLLLLVAIAATPIQGAHASR